MIYKKCPFCGANLDPGEKCDCDHGAQRDSDKNNNEKEKKQWKIIP